MWKRSHGGTIEAPPDERGGNRYVLPNATAPHLDSTKLRRTLDEQMYSGSRLKADLAHGKLFGGRRTAIGRQSSIAPILNAPKNSGLNGNVLAKLSRRKVVRDRQRASLVRFQGNLLGQHDVLRDQMIIRHEAPARSRQGGIV
jgi:hypothetical protein